jgi:hypothetical protein
MGRGCSTNGEMINMSKFLSEDLKGRNHLGDGVNSKIIFKWILNKIVYGGNEWNNMPQGRSNNGLLCTLQ